MNAIKILEKGDVKQSIFDRRQMVEGEMFVKADVRHILDFAFRIPRILPNFIPNEVQLSGSVL